MKKRLGFSGVWTAGAAAMRMGGARQEPFTVYPVKEGVSPTVYAVE